MTRLLIVAQAKGLSIALRTAKRYQSGSSSDFGSGSQKPAATLMMYATVPTRAHAYASLVGRVAPGIELTSCVVTRAADVPIMRPPTFAAKLSPVPRRYVGYTRGR